MPSKPSKFQRRAAFIFSLQQRASQYTHDAILARLGTDHRLPAEAVNLIAQAFADGACAAIDAEDGKVRS